MEKSVQNSIYRDQKNHVFNLHKAQTHVVETEIKRKRNTFELERFKHSRKKILSLKPNIRKK